MHYKIQSNTSRHHKVTLHALLHLELMYQSVIQINLQYKGNNNIIAMIKSIWPNVSAIEHNVIYCTIQFNPMSQRITKWCNEDGRGSLILDPMYHPTPAICRMLSWVVFLNTNINANANTKTNANTKNNCKYKVMPWRYEDGRGSLILNPMYDTITLSLHNAEAAHCTQCT